MGLGLADVTRGYAFQARGLLLALRVGDKTHVARAICFEALYHASRGNKRRPRTQRLLDEARRIAVGGEDPLLHAWVEGMTGAVDCLGGEFAAAVLHQCRAEQIFRERTAGTTWELNHTRLLLMVALRNLGAYGDLGRRLDEYLRDADARGDQWVKVMMTRSFASVWLARHDPARARLELERTPGIPRRGPFVEIQEWSAVRAQLEIDLYEGNAADARARHGAVLREVSRSLLMRAQILRTEFCWAMGRLALAEAQAAPAASPERRRALAEATHLARRLEREQVAYASATASLLAAGVAVQGLVPERAVTILRDALPACDRAGLALYAAAARRRLGELVGGAEGQGLIRGADAWMANEAILDPARMTDLIAPGFASPSLRLRPPPPPPPSPPLPVSASPPR